MNRHYLRESDYEEGASNEDDDRPGVIAVALALAIVLLVALANVAAAETTVTRGTWDGYKGSRIVANDAGEVLELCVHALEELGPGTYTCRTSVRVVVQEPPACPPLPPVDSRVQQCPEGTVGTWTQTREPLRCESGAWIIGDWLPATVPVGICAEIPPPPPELTAPTGLTATIAPNATNPARWNITLTWQAVPGATSYGVKRCTGPSCSSFSTLDGVSEPNYVNRNLPSGFTYRYRVEARRGDESSAASAIVAMVTKAPQEPPPPTGVGVANLSWNIPDKNSDGTTLSNLAGFEIVYGTSPSALSKTIVIENAGLSAYVIDKLPSGTWYFGVKSFNSSGTRSALSNVTSKTIP